MRIHGSPQPRILIVNDCVGAPEEERRVPLAGAPHFELERMKQAAGISNSDVATTVCSSIRGPSYELAPWIDFPSKKTCPPASYVAAHNAYIHPSLLYGLHELWQQIEYLKPNVVVTLGEEATWLLTGRRGIGDLRGSVLESKRPSCMGPGGAHSPVKVIPTYHPRKVLRNYPWRWDVIRDLTRANQESLFPQIRKPDWLFHVGPSFDQAWSFIENLGEEVTADIETRNRQITCIGLGENKREAMCLPITAQGGSFWPTLDEEFEMIRHLMKNLKQRKVVGQNFLYDAFYLAWLWGGYIYADFDTLVAQHVLLPGFPKSLDYLASYYCDYYTFWKHDSKEWSGYINDVDLWIYNCEDIVYTNECRQNLEVSLRQAGLTKQFRQLMRQFEPCLRMMSRGINSTNEARQRMSKEIAEAMQRKQTFVDFVFDQPVKMRGPHLSKLFYEDLKLPVVKSRTTGQPTTDDDALDKIAAKTPLVMPICKRVQSYRTLGILRSNFLESETPNGRFYCGIKQAGARTFRFASSKNPMGMGTNLQNVPNLQDDEEGADPDIPNLRKLFFPDPGFTLAEFDLSKADLRVVVWQSGEEELKEALRAGVNIYKEHGTRITGLPYRRAKSLLHGTNYGGKPAGMSTRLGVTQALVRSAQEKWFDAYPGIRRWQQRVEEELMTRRTTTNKFGFRIFWGDRLEGLLPEALAWDPQSTVALVINEVLFWFYETIEKQEDKGQILMQIHDSILTQIRDEYVEEVIPRTLEAFNQVVVPFDDPLIIPGECKYGKGSWADLHPWEG